MKLVLVARSQDLLKELKSELLSECLVMARDLRLPDVPAEIVTTTLEHFGRLVDDHIGVHRLI